MWDGGLFLLASALALARRKKLAGPKIHRFGGLQFPITWLVYVVEGKMGKHKAENPSMGFSAFAT